MTVNRELVACKDEHTEIFYSEYTLDMARELCESCPQRKPCLEDEVLYELGKGADSRAGVYAGFTPHQRYALEKSGQALRCCGRLRDPNDVRAGILRCRFCIRGEVVTPLSD